MEFKNFDMLCRCVDDFDTATKYVDVLGATQLS